MEKQMYEPKIPIESQIAFVEEFKIVRTDYVEFAVLVEKILKRAVKNLSILAIVQTRPKCILSFASKIIKKDKYTNPLKEVTDLCGARVIVHFQNQVEKICDFIKDNFEIDEENSLDVKSRLAINEFGYRSIHYIIIPKRTLISGVRIPEKFKTLKAEVQVRTLAEHVWADISHDRVYKTELNLPVEWRREAARLSAILEEADDKFARMAGDIDSVTRVYELQLLKNNADKRLLMLESLIEVLKDDYDEYQDQIIENCLRIAAIYRAKNKFDKAVEILKPLQTKPLNNAFLMSKLAFEFGMMLALDSVGKKDDETCYGVQYTIANGVESLDELDSDTFRDKEQEISYMYYRYGRLLQRSKDEFKQAADYFNRAYCSMPDNPLYLVAMIETLLLANPAMASYNINLFRTHIKEAAPKLYELIGIGIKQVAAYFAIGHCFLFLNDESKCLNAYAKAVETILNNDFLTCYATVEMEIELIGRLGFVNPGLVEKIELLLNTATVLKNDPVYNLTRSRGYLEKQQTTKEPLKTPVVIIAGSASKMDDSKADEYTEYIRELMLDFRGTIISGGTTAGIPGLVGRVKSELEKTKPVQFDLIAYQPQDIEHAEKSPGYDSVCGTNSNKFSSLEVMNYWADIVFQGINPNDVMLLGIEGGNIAALEYRIALALGAKVVLLAYSGGATTEILQDNYWKSHRNLISLPDDPLTVWALVNIMADTVLSPLEKDFLAKEVHDFYRESRLKGLRPDTDDINKYKVVVPWENLDPSLQNSNLSQVSSFELLLKRVGLSIRKSKKPVVFDIEKNLSREDFDFLAETEHARWNAERLLEGWRYGRKKDVVKKLNPNIVSWKNLGDEIRKYDYDPVKNIPSLLAKIGYEVYKPE